MTGPHHQWNRQSEAENQQKHAVPGGSRHRDNVVQAHHKVGNDDGTNRRPKAAGGLDLVSSFVVLRKYQLQSDPHQQCSTDDFHVTDRQQGHRKERQNHPQGDRTTDTPENTEPALLFWKIATGQSDDHCVVPRQQNVDENDLQYGYPELGIQRIECEGRMQLTGIRIRRCREAIRMLNLEFVVLSFKRLRLQRPDPWFPILLQDRLQQLAHL